MIYFDGNRWGVRSVLLLCREDVLLGNNGLFVDGDGGGVGCG